MFQTSEKGPKRSKKYPKNIQNNPKNIRKRCEPKIILKTSETIQKRSEKYPKKIGKDPKNILKRSEKDLKKIRKRIMGCFLGCGIPICILFNTYVPSYIIIICFAIISCGIRNISMCRDTSY